MSHNPVLYLFYFLLGLAVTGLLTLYKSKFQGQGQRLDGLTTVTQIDSDTNNAPPPNQAGVQDRSVSKSRAQASPRLEVIQGASQFRSEIEAGKGSKVISGNRLNSDSNEGRFRQDGSIFNQKIKSGAKAGWSYTVSEGNTFNGNKTENPGKDENVT